MTPEQRANLAITDFITGRRKMDAVDLAREVAAEIREAVLAEREACAQLAESGPWAERRGEADDIAAAIRARSAP